MVIYVMWMGDVYYHYNRRDMGGDIATVMDKTLMLLYIVTDTSWISVTMATCDMDGCVLCTASRCEWTTQGVIGAHTVLYILLQGKCTRLLYPHQNSCMVNETFISYGGREGQLQQRLFITTISSAVGPDMHLFQRRHHCQHRLLFQSQLPHWFMTSALPFSPPSVASSAVSMLEQAHRIYRSLARTQCFKGFSLWRPCLTLVRTTILCTCIAF